MPANAGSTQKAVSTYVARIAFGLSTIDLDGNDPWLKVTAKSSVRRLTFGRNDAEGKLARRNFQAVQSSVTGSVSQFARYSWAPGSER